VAGSQLLCNKIIDYEAEIAARLAMAPNCRLVKVERLRHAANEAFALEACYLSAEEFGGLTSAPLGRNSLFSTLERDYGVELAHADEEVDATAADPRTAELLGLSRGAPLLRIRQVIYSSKGKATIYVLGFYRSDRHTLFIRRFR
jgi:GntR family transcriptional regulator